MNGVDRAFNPGRVEQLNHEEASLVGFERYFQA